MGVAPPLIIGTKNVTPSDNRVAQQVRAASRTKPASKDEMQHAGSR